MTRQLLIEVWVFFYLAILQSGVVKAECQTDNCANCIGNKCMACNDDYFIDRNLCYSCYSGCTACTGSNYWQCSACATGYYLSGNTCNQCYSRCTACTGSNYWQCSACATGYYLSGNTCNRCYSLCTACTGSNYWQCSACATGYYISGNTCNQCASQCTACSGSGYSQCSACAAGYYLSGKSCNKCDSGCTACTGSDYSQCSACAGGYYLNGTRCNQCDSRCTVCTGSNYWQCYACAAGYYLGGNSCNQCDSRCSACTGSNNWQCSGCAAGYYLGGNTCNQCDSRCTACTGSNYWQCSACAAGYYLGGNTCNQCDSRCSACTGSNNWQCSVCAAGYYLGGNTCNQCDSRCTACTGSNNWQCSACAAGHYLSGNICNQCDSRCTACTGSKHWQCSACAAGYYLSGNMCNQCDSRCTACTGSNNWQCSACAAGYYISGNTCNQCDSRCTACTGSNNWQCSSCAAGYYLSGNICNQCDSRCTACTGSNNWQCSACAAGYYLSGNTCNQCDSRCTACTGSNNWQCSACAAGYYLSDGNTCNQCDSPCTKCSSKTQCTECITGHNGPACESCYSDYYNINTFTACICRNSKCSIYSEGTCTVCVDDTWYPRNQGCCPCSQNCIDQRCNSSGDCIQDCIKGFYGTACQGDCSNLDNCLECTTRYAVASTAPLCVECVSGYFPTNTGCKVCNTECRSYAGPATCDQRNGTCLNGCDDGWYGDKCDVGCPPGCAVCNQPDGDCTKCDPAKYGVVCGQTCSDGCKPGNTTCEQTDGTCTQGCLPGRWKDTCENVCNQGCLNTNCNTSNGNCIEGCTRKYSGLSCESRCSNNCLEVDGHTEINVCQREGGDCIGGCKPGYHGDTCVQECGNCQNSTCHIGNGTCTHGCETGYIGPTCIQAAAVGANGATIGGAVGGTLGVIIIVVVVIVLKNWKRRGHGKSTNENKRVKEEPGPVYYNVGANGEGQENGMQDGKHSPDPEKPIPAVKIQALHVHVSAPMANPPKPVPKRPSKKDAPSQQQQQQPQPDVVQSASREQKSDNRRASVNSLLEPLDEGGPVPVCKFEEGDTYYNTAAMMKSRIPVNDLAAFVTKKINSDYVTEFKKLPPGLTRPYRDAQQPQNVAKNRYKNIYPYDDTRVFLTDGAPDYINASYIQGHRSQRDYIAALGPITTTIDDFWRLVWQEGSQVIVMLTRLVEAAHTKCQQYWPNRGTADNYGDVRVACHTEDSYAEFAVRSFSVTKGLETRKLHHVHFTAWPDKGVPDDVTGLIEFRQKVNNLQTRPDVPLIVHCSAGIGRTGTFIALDTLTRSGEDEGTVDIFGCVIAMRGQRVNLVQTDEQYEYLHHAVVHSLTFGCRSIPAEEMSQRYAELLSEQPGGLTQLDTRFEQLQSVGEAMSKETESSVHTNRSFASKNRTGSDIPGDRYRPRLFMNRTPGASNYINAVRLNGFKTKDMFIAAQTPLPTTIVDFLTMIVQEKCTCIVSMDADESLTALEKNYWPLVNGTMKHGIFTVTCPEMTSTMYSIRRKLVISTHVKKTNEDHVMWQTTYTGWPSSDVIPRDPETLLRMIQDIDRLGADSDSNGPVIVYCMDGAERCGLYCAVSVLVEKMQVDHEVSLVNTLRQVKSRRRSAIPNKEQYQFCYQAIVAYLESFSTYSNFSLTQVNLTPHDSGPDSMVTTA